MLRIHSIETFLDAPLSSFPFHQGQRPWLCSFALSVPIAIGIPNFQFLSSNFYLSTSDFGFLSSNFYSLTSSLYFPVTTISTLRFCFLPSSVSLSEMGLVLECPTYFTRLYPLAIRYLATCSALFKAISS